MQSPSDSALLLEALAFAAHKHRNQRRKGAEGLPYVNHAIGVARVLAGEGNVTDSVVLCAAVLHDTIEDTATSPGELMREFGAEITAIVLEVSDDKSLPKEERKRLQIERAARISHPARLVKLADKICNLRDMVRSPPADWTLQRTREYFEWARCVIDALRGTHAGLEVAFDAAYARRPG